MSYRGTYSQPVTLLDDVSSTVSSDGLNVKDFRHIVLSVGTSNSADLTVQVQGSIEDDENEPDWSSSPTQTNQWSYLAVKDLENLKTDEGDTGIVFSGTDDVVLVEVNTNGLNELAVDVTAHNAGNVTVKAMAYGY